jgi:hypothetical protein
VTSPVEEIRVECPRCTAIFDDWTRGSLNLDLDDFDDEYVREASTATCPECGFVVDLGALVVEGEVWRWSRADEAAVRRSALPPDAQEEIAAAEAALRAVDADHELLRPEVLRSALWLQAVAWALGTTEGD